MTADLQNSRHQLGRLVGVNKRENTMASLHDRRDRPASTDR